MLLRFKGAFQESCDYRTSVIIIHRYRNILSKPEIIYGSLSLIVNIIGEVGSFLSSNLATRAADNTGYKLLNIITLEYSE